MAAKEISVLFVMAVVGGLRYRFAAKRQSIGGSVFNRTPCYRLAVVFVLKSSASAHLLLATFLAAVTGLVLMRARRQSEVLSYSRDVWEEWELRGAVFLSLALQIVLICLGNCRKHIRWAWIRVLTWLAYLSADSVAIYALGMISNMISKVKNDGSVSKMDPHVELSAFWAPFLLLHLGGPDTISAYAMEDNELWLRHSLTLVNQTGMTVYVLAMAWTYPSLSFPAVLILLLGFYKYGERVWVLRAASNEHFKDSLTKSQPHQKYSNKIVEECELKRAEGYNFVPHHVIKVRDDAAIMIDGAIQHFSSEYEDAVGTLLAASNLVDTTQRLFANHLFSLEERETYLSILKGRGWDFKIIEIELGLIYDLFYSKAKAVYTSWGFICRLAISFSICGALAACWLIMNKQSAIIHFINRIQPLTKRRRWSNSMGQHSLKRLFSNRNDSRWWRLLKQLCVDEMVVKFHCQDCKDVTENVRELILLKIQKKNTMASQKLSSSWIDWQSFKLSTQKLLEQLKWSIELDFDMSILVWHIATQLCSETSTLEDKSFTTLEDKSFTTSLHLSQYMLYLLVMHPSMLPEDKVKYVQVIASRLASEIDRLLPKETKWEVISEVWADMLIYAANNCKASDHAQQMRRGGELITHVWFLMAHYGLTDHFQIQPVPEIAEIIVNSW
ncbi:uncharacterized protein LOC115737990 [Rhodamnia argentea]|uniref:Uncharacterized protein LOC115737990 n=1 Tax=Rhodamnia argentea TaxID=178133 RepID=A0A8B8NUX2_9MYRT|nr:uncharacterized protein LOC115737990 [Rhodamnia argentea]